MQNSFLFRVPGQHGMYDFNEIKAMPLHKQKMLSVIEVIKPTFDYTQSGRNQGGSRNVGKMSVAAILSKFG